MEAKDVRHIRNLVSRNGGRVGSAMPRNIATVPKQQANAGPACSICGDTGWKTVQNGANRSVTRCDCKQVSRTKFLIEQAKFPPRYENCDLAGYETGTQSSLAAAKIAAQKFIANYPIDKIGFLLIGPSGAGKTHLSVAILRGLIVQKGIACLFCDYRDLLKQNLTAPMKMELWVANSDGSNAKQITRNGCANFAPTFTPDGNKLLFSSNKNHCDSNDFELYTINLDGAGLEQVTNYGGFNAFPEFSPDGKKIVFISSYQGSTPYEFNVFTADWK